MGNTRYITVIYQHNPVIMPKMIHSSSPPYAWGTVLCTDLQKFRHSFRTSWVRP